MGGGGGATVSDFFTKNPNLKKNITFFFMGRGWGGERGRVGLEYVFFFHKKSKSYIEK